MPTRTGSIVVPADADTTWSACADIARFPDFIVGISSFTERADGSHEWQGRAFGITRTWHSTWTARERPTLIAWQTDDSMVPSGRVLVEPVTSTTSRVTIEMHYEPATLLDRLLVNRLATRARLWWDLRAFRRHVEQSAQNVGTGGIDVRTAAGA